jgi:F0F1-type ATP synthase assembly protein I
MRQFALAMELPFIVVAAVAVGGLIGHTLDERLRTAPFLMIFFGALGLYAGIREVLRRLTKTGARGGGNAGR